MALQKRCWQVHSAVTPKVRLQKTTQGSSPCGVRQDDKRSTAGFRLNPGKSIAASGLLQRSVFGCSMRRGHGFVKVGDRHRRRLHPACRLCDGWDRCVHGFVHCCVSAAICRASQISQGLPTPTHTGLRHDDGLDLSALFLIACGALPNCARHDFFIKTRSR